MGVDDDHGVWNRVKDRDQVLFTALQRLVAAVRLVPAAGQPFAEHDRQHADDQKCQRIEHIAPAWPGRGCDAQDRQGDGQDAGTHAAETTGGHHQGRGEQVIGARRRVGKQQVKTQ